MKGAEEDPREGPFSLVLTIARKIYCQTGGRSCSTVEERRRTIQQKEVLCRCWRLRGSLDEETIQVVLPKEYRTRVLKLAHDVPMSGHLG